MKNCSVFLAVALMLVLPGLAHARPVTQEYQLAPTDCAGDPVPLADYSAIEFYVDTQPIPVSGGDPCARSAGGGPVDVPPLGANLVPGVPADGQVTFNLLPGEYWLRARVQDQAGAWSNLSNEMTIVVPPSSQRPPVLIRITF